MNKKEMENKDFNEMNEMLDKLIELKNIKKNRTPVWKVILYFFVGLFTIVFLAFACFMMYKQSFTMETLLAVLLSFFSIGLSIMFYIQSDRTSSSFYKDSYQIMKEVSVTLGKIEAGFGEKLSAINSKIGTLEDKKHNTQQVLDEKQKEQEKNEKQLLEAKNSEEKQNLIDKIKETEKEIVNLRNDLVHLEHNKHFLEMENRKLRRDIHFNKLDNYYKNNKSSNDIELDVDNDKLNEYLIFKYLSNNDKINGKNGRSKSE